MKRSTFTAFKAMWRLLAVSLPFCIAGTRAAANAHRTVIPAGQSRTDSNFNSFILFGYIPFELYLLFKKSPFLLSNLYAFSTTIVLYYKVYHI